MSHSTEELRDSPLVLDEVNGQLSLNMAQVISFQTSNTSSTLDPTQELKTLPLEVRRHIWKSPLQNPDLGNASSIQKRDNYGAEVKYGLAPVILRVCKQFHEEGMQILYDENKFLIECIKRFNTDKMYRSALTRYRKFRSNTPYYVKNRIESARNMKSVKHWKVLVAPNREPVRRP